MFFLSNSKHPNLVKLYQESKNIYSSLPPVKKREKRKRARKILKLLFLSVIAICIAGVAWFGYHFANLKTIYTEAVSGKKNIELAASMVKNGNYEQAIDFSSRAASQFDYAAGEMEIYAKSFPIEYLPYFRTQVNDAKYLLQSASVISKAVKGASEFGYTFSALFDNNEIRFLNLDKSRKREMLEILYRSTPELNGIKANVELALINLGKIEYNGVLLPFKGKIGEIHSNLYNLHDLLSNAVPASELLPSFLGYPEKSAYLLILQNSDELRPTGGFVGTYGIIEFEDGEVLRLDTHDIYHMDMPVRNKVNVRPPEPLIEYLGVEKWFMRDANWSPSWPQSALKLEEFFYKEDNLLPPKDKINDFDGKFSGVIGITPELVTDLLSYLGPVSIEGEEYNKDNFSDLLQYRVEKGFIELGVPSWHRKEVIGEIINKLEERIFALAPRELYFAFNILIDNLNKKNILLYFHDPSLQDMASRENWAGEINGSESDYFMVIDANMAALKTDAVIDRKIEYELIRPENESLAKLTLSYSHQGDFDWKTTRYRSYTRVYVPHGSRLISIRGNENEEIDIYNELGKTVFGYFISIEPGQIGRVEIKYALPDFIYEQINAGKYMLIAQKQPGSRISRLVVKLDFLDAITKYSPTGFEARKFKDSGIKWENEFDIDKKFIVLTE